MDDGFVEVYNALDNVSSQIEGLESSGVHRQIPYDLFRQVIPLHHQNCQRSVDEWKKMTFNYPPDRLITDHFNGVCLCPDNNFELRWILARWFILIPSMSCMMIRIIGQSTRSPEEIVAKLVGATSSEGFLVIVLSSFRPYECKSIQQRDSK